MFQGLLCGLQLVCVLFHLLQYSLNQIFQVMQNLIDMLVLLHHVLKLFLFGYQFLGHRMQPLPLPHRILYLILVIYQYYLYYFFLNELKSLLDKDVAAIMMTNPNTLGIYEENVLEIYLKIP